MRGIIKQILYASRRDALFLGTTFIVLICAGLSCFIGSNAVVEAQEARIAYTAGISRIAVMLGFIVFVVFYIKRMFENHEIEVILSHSISRTKVLIAMFCGFAITLFTLLVPVCVILLLLKTSFTGLLVWALSIYLEGLLMLSFTLCCALIINSQVHSLAGCVMMYIIGRVIGSFVYYIQLSLKLDLYSILSSILRVLSICLPRLDLFGKTSWLLYSDFTIGSIGLFLTQTLAFCGIFVFAAIIDLKKKEF
ncbi:MAG: hypothetical protein IJ590_04760 [Rickettsiales bacterium]|nr:hypothetical protein [Rickettsiales bacterium]